jgi:hypothetical protein
MLGEAGARFKIGAHPFGRSFAAEEVIHGVVGVAG